MGDLDAHSASTLSASCLLVRHAHVSQVALGKSASASWREQQLFFFEMDHDIDASNATQLSLRIQNALLKDCHVTAAPCNCHVKPSSRIAT